MSAQKLLITNAGVINMSAILRKKTFIWYIMAVPKLRVISCCDIVGNSSENVNDSTVIEIKA